MPIRYVGRKSKFVGKTLIEILGNLKNFGVGRVVVRNSHSRYKAPSFFRIVKVEPEMDPNNKLATVWADIVFRGAKHNVLKVPAPYAKDFRLLSKEEEKDYCKVLHEEIPKRLMPAFIPFPPLFRKLIEQEKEQKGEPVTEEPMLPMIYSKKPYLWYRKVEDGEAPDVDLNDVHAVKSLYADVFPDIMKEGHDGETPEVSISDVDDLTSLHDDAFPSKAGKG